MYQKIKGRNGYRELIITFSQQTTPARKVHQLVTIWLLYIFELIYASLWTLDFFPRVFNIKTLIKTYDLTWRYFKALFQLIIHTETCDCVFSIKRIRATLEPRVQLFYLIINLNYHLCISLGEIHRPGCASFPCIKFYSLNICINWHYYKLNSTTWGGIIFMTIHIQKFPIEWDDFMG